MKPKVFIVIPAYNEEGMIGTVIKNLKSNKYNNIIVVDDGSADKTYDIALSKGAYALKHVLNRGQGAALKTGIDFALINGADIIVTFDADGQHRADEINKMIKPIVEKKFEVTLGSRFLRNTEDVPFLRKVYLKVGAFVLLIMYGIKLTDSHNGFRALSRKAAQQIEIKADKMDHASEIPEQIKKKRLKYREVPVNIKYTEYSLKHGQKFATNAFNIFFRMVINKFLR